MACLWALVHGYAGMWHDAQLYTFQALARLKPELLGNDLYLRFGSQDNFTLFSPLYAAAISVFGMEPAASLLTFASNLAFLCAAWSLAHRVLPRPLAWLGIGLLIASRAEYGAYQVFRFVEDFVTPRMAAEACVLAGLGLLISGRNIGAGVWLLAAAMLHPLMAAAGIAFALCIKAVLPHPRLTAVICLVLAGAAAVVFGLTSIGASLQFDAEWLQLVRQRGYLFVVQWRLVDWSSVVVPLVTAGIGSFALTSVPARTCCRASLIIGVSGIALTLLGVDMLHIIPVAQSQPWRSLWLTDVMATMLLPAILALLWSKGPTGRAATLLLVACWLLRGEVYALYVLPLALAAGAAAFAEREPGPAAQRMIVGGAWLLASLSLVWVVANIRLFAHTTPVSDGLPAPIRLARTWGREGSLPALAAAGLWWLCQPQRPRSTLYATAAAAALLLALLIPAGIAERTHVTYTAEAYRSLSRWRRLIPPGAEVFWATGDPLCAWVLLERPSYMSLQQAGSNLFSRRAGMELERRAEDLRKVFGVAAAASHSPPTLATVCARSDVRYIVTSYDLQAPPLDLAPAGVPEDFRDLRLYRCDR
jgi:hypothetical protein